MQQRANTGSTAEQEWIETALQEYEQVASLCNAQSLLGNPAMSSSSSSVVPAADHINGDESSCGALDTNRLASQLQQHELHESLSKYYREIDALRKTHASLKAQLASLSKVDGDNDAKDNTTKRRPSPVSEAFSNHIQLSERVIRTVMRSTNTGQCGVLYENGLVRTSSAQDHEVNVVALASLRASLSRLKANFG